MAQHHSRYIEIAEGDGRSPDADPEVVNLVHHCVLGIVGDDPEQIGCHQYPGDERHSTGLGGKSHGYAEAEGDAEIGLGYGKKTLGEGITCRQEQRQHRKLQCQAVQGQYQQERYQAQSGGQQQRFLRSHLAGCHRAVFGALDMRIEIAVGIIIDDTSGGAHQYGAEQEYHQNVHVRETASCQPQAPQGGPQQQQDADRLVQPHQLLVEGEAPR